jgi:hypothetical protein
MNWRIKIFLIPKNTENRVHHDYFNGFTLYSISMICVVNKNAVVFVIVNYIIYNCCTYLILRWDAVLKENKEVLKLQ